MRTIHPRSRRRLAVLGLTTLAGLGALAGPANAVGAADQVQALTDGEVLVNPGLLQTFTVGTTGTLDGIELMSPVGGPMNVQIYRIGPDGTVPGTPVLPAPVLGALFPGVPTTIGFITPPSVTAGEQLGIAVGPVRSTSLVTLAQQSGDPYAAGTLYRVIAATTFTPIAADLQFRTFVTAPTPAPSSLTVDRLRDTKGVPTAQLHDAISADPIAGAPITFELRRANGTVARTCVASTDATGTARCRVRWWLPRHGSLVATYAGDAQHEPASATSR